MANPRAIDFHAARIVSAPYHPDTFDEPSLMRFVVLHHQIGSSFDRTKENHLDWMWQVPDAEGLWTWSTAVIPIERLITTRATRLNDHRIRYLDYEGPISDDRGRVDQLASGEYEIATKDGQEFAARITRVDNVLGDLKLGNLNVGDHVVIQRKRAASDELWESELRIE